MLRIFGYLSSAPTPRRHQPSILGITGSANPYNKPRSWPVDESPQAGPPQTGKPSAVRSWGGPRFRIPDFNIGRGLSSRPEMGCFRTLLRADVLPLGVESTSLLRDVCRPPMVSNFMPQGDHVLFT